MLFANLVAWRAAVTEGASLMGLMSIKGGLTPAYAWLLTASVQETPCSKSGNNPHLPPLYSAVTIPY